MSEQPQREAGGHEGDDEPPMLSEDSPGSLAELHASLTEPHHSFFHGPFRRSSDGASVPLQQGRTELEG